MRLEEKVAQLFVLGSDTPQFEAELEPFFPYGLGGVLLFRHHSQPFTSAYDFQAYLSQLKSRFQGHGLSLIGIDQEGGQVERLPHWYFPTGVLPVTFALNQNVDLCRSVNAETAKRLRWLGINLNFTPTVDLNTQLLNPIIGVRAYGKTPQAVLPFAKAVIDSHLQHGVLPVIKHFPGHGSGTVDSHLDLPHFDAWQENELEPFQALLSQYPDIGIMVAHGMYPQLFHRLQADSRLPASLSQPLVTQLLRGKLHAQGPCFTDDLMMQAVHRDRDPVETALLALEAGHDFLVYRRGQPEAWDAFQAILQRIRQGKLSESLLDDKLTRILTLKQKLDSRPLPVFSEDDWSPETCHQMALDWAKASLVELHHHYPSPLPITHQTRWALVAPDPLSMIHYQPDSKDGNSVLAWCQYYNLAPTAVSLYSINPKEPIDLAPLAVPDLQTLVFLAFNSILDTRQQQAYEALKKQHPQAKLILASVGMPTDSEVLSKPWVHWQLPSYRPAAMHALFQKLV